MGNISKEDKEESKNTELEMWRFFYREWAKLNDVVRAYDKFAINIEINHNKYSEIFSLILDSFTRYIIVTLDLFFQRRKNVQSLYKFNALANEDVNEIRNKANKFIILRNNKIGHLSKNFEHKNNFEYLSKKGIDEVRDILRDIDLLLRKVISNNSYTDGWVGIKNSLECLFEDLNKLEKLWQLSP